MKDGFVKVLARSVPVVPGKPEKNAKEIIAAIQEAQEDGGQVLCLQELCLTGATCGDLYLLPALLDGALSALEEILRKTADTEALTVLGLPFAVDGCVYNCACVLQSGRILGLVPKTAAKSPFTAAPEGLCDVAILEQTVPFGTELLFTCDDQPLLKLAVEVGEDAFLPIPPSTYAAMAGATVICRPAADPIVTDWREEATVEESLKALSRRLKCAYFSANAGEGESTGEFAYNGECFAFENGESLLGEADVDLITNLRRKDGNFPGGGFVEVPFTLEERELSLSRSYERYPLCGDPAKLLEAQVLGLARRLQATGAKTVVLGLSGGLDSTLALRAAVYTMRHMERPVTDILAVSLPCFGTTDRTKSNAQRLAEGYGVRFREIPIGKAVEQHFKDIGLSPDDRSLTYENAQARERTQILMDLAGMENGIVLGTGDMSELALGWCTYNGDHMSMYAVNAGITKTALQEMLREEIFLCMDETLCAVLQDVLDTPISPELLPPNEGEIDQKTEDLVGPYELHDFFLYHLVHNGFTPEKILRIALHTWTEAIWAEDSVYDEETVRKWLSVFLRRFSTQQFKRSCMPEGVSPCPVSLSPRSGFTMPSDAGIVLGLE